MRYAATVTLLAALGAGLLPGAAEAAALRRAYFRVTTPEARQRVAPFVKRELPDGVVSAAIPPAMLATYSEAPGLTFLGYEAVFHPAPLTTEQVPAGAVRPSASDTRTCTLPHFIPPVGWGIKALYGDPNLVLPSGGAGVRIGIVDTGIYPHPDIVRRIAKCLNVTFSQDLPACADTMNHGTLVASVIAADGGADGLGMYGMAPEASIYSYRACDQNDECWGAYLAAGIYAAIADSVNIINVSLEGPGNDDVVHAAIDAAVAHNILVTVAAGNSPPYSYVGYPAVYPEVMAVGAITETLAPWAYTANGLNNGDYRRDKQEVELAGPGASVLSAMNNGCWVLASGTSLAAPLVAGLAAKMWNGSATAVRARLDRSARFHDVGVAGDDSLTGFGMPTIQDVSGLFVINTANDPGVILSPSGSVAVSPGASQTITIAADKCHVITDVLVDGVSRGRITSYTFAGVNGDHILQVRASGFGPFTIASGAGPGGWITPAGATLVPCGANQYYSITAPAGCAAIQDVKVDGVSKGPITSYIFTDVQVNHTIQATISSDTTYTIKAIACGGGTVTPSGDVPAGCGNNRTFTFATYNGVGDLVVDGVHLGAAPQSYTFYNVTANHTLEVTFAGNTQYTINATASGSGTIVPSGATGVACGGSQTFSIAPVNGCSVIQDVLVDGVSRGPLASYTFSSVGANHTIKAVFNTSGPFSITASTNTGGAIMPSGATSVACGGSQAYTINPLGCSVIQDVSVDGVSQGPVSAYTFSGVTGPHSIAVTFAPRDSFTIAASATGGGTISPSGVTTVPCARSVSYIIGPTGACPVLQDVVVDGVSRGPIPSYTFATVTANHTIMATFAPGPFTINASGPAGTISPSGSSSVPCGGSQSYSIAAVGPCPYDVKVDGVSQGPITSYTFANVRGGHTISVIVDPGPFTISASGPLISPFGPTSVPCGGSQTYTITQTGPCPYDVKVDGVSKGAITSYTFTNVQSGHTISVTVTQGPFTISASGPSGTISPSGSTSVPCGLSQSYTISANGACSYDVKVDGVSQGPITSYTFTNVQSGHTISVTTSAGPFTIAASGPSGTISPFGSTSVPCGGSQTYTITTSGGCPYDVTVDGVSQGPITSYTFTNVRSGHLISVSPSAGPFTISASPAAGGTISPPGVFFVTCGGIAVYSFTAQPCYRVGNVVVDGVSMGAILSYTFTGVTANHTIGATFVHAGPFSITASANLGGSIDPSTPVSLNCGLGVTYRITSSDNCHPLQDVKVDGVSQGPLTTYSFINVQANHTIEAVFSALGPFTIDASADAGGTISPSGSATLACGASQTYTIAPADDCHRIQSVKVDGISRGVLASFTFPNMRANHTIEAAFTELGPYTINASAGAGGSISPEGGAGVECGTAQSYAIAPSDGCHAIQDVVVDGVSQGPITSYTFDHVKAAHTIQASFAALGPFAVKASAGPGGAISPDGASSAPCGTSLSYTITPSDSCHVIQDVSVDGVPQGPLASYTFKGVTTGHAIAATFAALGPYAIKASAGPGGAIQPSGVASVACGASQSFTISPADVCQVIRDVVVDGTSVGAVGGYTFTNVRSDHTIAASAGPEMTLAETHTGSTWAADGTIDLTVTGGVAPFVYDWSNGAKTQDLAGLTSGTYEVRVTDGEGCSQDLSVAIVGDVPSQAALGKPTPNPSSGAVRLRYGIPPGASARVSVLDLQGREVAVLAEGARPTGWTWATWDGRGRDGRAPGGIYFIRLQSGGHQIVQRFALVR